MFTSLLTAIISMIYLAVGKGTPLKRVFLQLVVEANQHFPQSSYPDFFHNATSNFSFLSSVLHLYMFCPTNQPSFIVVKKLIFFGKCCKKTKCHTESNMTELKADTSIKKQLEMFSQLLMFKYTNKCLIQL